MRRRAEIVHTAIELDVEMTYGTPKTLQRRSVPIPRTLVDALAEHDAGKALDDLVFTSPRGRRWAITISGAVCLRPLLPRSVCPGSLRITSAIPRRALLLRPAPNVKVVRSMLGHASAAMPLDVYAGLFGDDFDTVADRLDEAAARARADYLRTAAQEARMLPLVLGGP
jgi:integrase